MIAFDQARVADSLPLTTACAGKERPARHDFQLRHFQTCDVPALPGMSANGSLIAAYLLQSDGFTGTSWQVLPILVGAAQGYA